MTAQITSRAVVEIERPARYGKQLVNHLKRKHGGAWDVETEKGWIQLGDGQARVEVVNDQLQLWVEAPAELVDRVEGVVGRHLVSFARGLTITVQWQRDDATEGSLQATE